MNGNSNVNTFQINTLGTFLLGYFEAKIEEVARSSDCSTSQLTEWLGQALRSCGPRSSYCVPALRNSTTQMDQAVPEVAVDVRAHRQAPRRLSLKARRNIANAQRKRWAKKRTKHVGIVEYWARMSPEERSAEMKRRRRVSMVNRAAA